MFQLPSTFSSKSAIEYLYTLHTFMIWCAIIVTKSVCVTIKVTVVTCGIRHTAINSMITFIVIPATAYKKRLHNIYAVALEFGTP